ncbi:hypothetical protein NP493_53g21035 [Ridgeia piscesae]|uniref:Metalloendopeptidase n=1 Tax=Ridgeia piscesae TaxID=27915 RepID=A0AAD9PBA6_RIDPI|nr:hypothetical protein NP493_53g21035 [Ridgeia piscesae]
MQRYAALACLRLDREFFLFQARSVGSKLWQPENGTREEWVRCHGTPCEQWQRAERKLAKLKTLALDDNKGADYPHLAAEGVPKDDKTPYLLDGCILLTEKQIDELLEDMRNSVHDRKKRATATTNFLKWNVMPIPWKFDGRHSESQKEKIRGAFQHWSDQTCIRFREVGTHDRVTTNHILVSANSGCYSHVGMVDLKPQSINLQASCISNFGTPVHEIGHSLGLWHEQQRWDRDDTVHVLVENLGYYRASCPNRLPRPCERDGYQDPNHCYRCRCPDGFGGTYCHEVAPSVNADCGGTVQATSSPQYIQSPGYDTDKHYGNRQQCNWIIKAPANHRVVLTFEDEFGLYCHNEEQCHHWVEVRTGTNLGRQGASGRKTLCGMHQMTNDNFDWTVQSGRTPSDETGPRSAISDSQPNYIYIEASSPRRYNDKAIIAIPQLYITGPHCVTFNYHMYGFHINELRLAKMNTWEELTTIWQQYNDHGDTWLSAKVDVTMDNYHKLAFVGVVGHEYSGDIALDNIEVTKGRC